MAEPCFTSPELSATEALRALAILATGRMTLGESGLRVAMGRRGFCRLALPDPFTRPGNQAVHTALVETFQSAVTEVFGRTPDRTRSRLDLDAHGVHRPVDAAVLLLVDSGVARRQSIAPQIDDEHLMVLHGVGETRAVEVAARLNVHPTALRFAAATAGDEPVLIFHLKDDPARVSSFHALATSGALDGLLVLDGFAAGPRSLFLPPDTPPDRDALGPFLTLCDALPDLASGPLPTEGPVCAVVIATDGDGARTVDLHPLHRLHYLEDAALRSPAGGGRDVVRIHRLEASAEGAERLAERVRGLDPPDGYRLELRHGFARPPSDLELERLREQIADLNERAAWMSGLLTPRPTLLRFTAAQLPALADAVRGFPLADIDDGRIRYGFQANGQEPAGVHYLMFDPDSAVMRDPFMVSRWRGNGEQDPMIFHVDPFFARFYGDSRTGSLVLVPERTALFPPLHGWSADSMDDHLRRTMGVWFHGEGGVQAIPDNPIYLFRPSADDDGTIAIEVLDADGFVPLRQRMGWINRNLELIDRLPVEELIVAMGDAAARHDLATRLAGEAARAEQAFDTAAAAATAFVGQRCDEMLDLLSDEIEQTVARARRAFRVIDDVHKDLATVETALSEVTRHKRTVDVATDAVAQERDRFMQESESFEHALAQEVKAADDTLVALEKTVTERLGRLRALYERLRDRVDGVDGGYR